MLLLYFTVILAARLSCADLLHQVTGSIRPETNIECSGSGAKCFCHRKSGAPYKPYQIDITLTLPSQSQPAPVIIFFHGHMLTTGDYTPYSKAAVSGGYAFLEYDITVDGSAVTPADAIEVQFLPAILKWASEINDRPGTPAKSKLKLDQVAVAGHSRGGKLAAFHFASGVSDQPFFAAYLLDPVECPCFAPCTSDCYPSAVSLLKSSDRAIGVSIAETTGCCNPHAGDCGLTCQAACYAATGNSTCSGRDAQEFLDAGSAGSQGHSQNAGHLQFADVQSATMAYLGNLLCGYNAQKTNKEVSDLAASHMVDWFDSQAATAVLETIHPSR